MGEPKWIEGNWHCPRCGDFVFANEDEAKGHNASTGHTVMRHLGYESEPVPAHYFLGKSRPAPTQDKPNG